jgi:hypothetical protein
MHDGDEAGFRSNFNDTSPPLDGGTGFADTVLAPATT